MHDLDDLELFILVLVVLGPTSMDAIMSTEVRQGVDIEATIGAEKKRNQDV